MNTQIGSSPVLERKLMEAFDAIRYPINCFACGCPMGRNDGVYVRMDGRRYCEMLCVPTVWRKFVVNGA